MKSITQDLKFKQAVMDYSFNHGVTNAAIRYKKTRQWIYYWRKRYMPGDIYSLQEKSRKPHFHPNAHTDEEIQLIENMRRRNPDEGLTMFWIRLKKEDIRVAQHLCTELCNAVDIMKKTRRKSPYMFLNPMNR